MSPRRREFQRWGAKGGAAVMGEKKRRGDKAYYAELGRKSGEARRRKREERSQ